MTSPHDPATFATRLTGRLARDGLSLRQAEAVTGVRRWVIHRATLGKGISGSSMLTLAAWLDSPRGGGKKRKRSWSWRDLSEKSV